VKDRNKPIARIVFFHTGNDESELADLISSGMARPPKTMRPFPRPFWTDPLPETTIDLTELIREERDAR
jgi:hypothetical protein